MPRRWVLLCAIGLTVLAVHLGVLIVLGPIWFDPEAPPTTPLRAVQVRSIERAPLPMAPHPTPLERSDVAEGPAPAAASTRTAPRGTPEAALAASAAPPAIAHAPVPDPERAGDLPVYATRLPPSGQWHFRLQRGLAMGEADLRWRLSGGGQYELQLEGRVAGVVMLDWLSRGQIDAAGLAPDRFALRRRGRDRLAANFQREAGKVTFSGPTHEHPLLPGAQDRLSWLLQLSAIVAAAPERFVDNTQVQLFVIGARGDGAVWTFAVQGIELLDAVPTLKLTREPRQLYDTRVEVWLDPAAHHMPLRVVQTPSGGGAALELMLERGPP